MRDIAVPQNTRHSTSPPIFAARASLSDITPLGVERMAIPSPLYIRGKSAIREYNPRVSALRAHWPEISRRARRSPPDVLFARCGSGSTYLREGRSSTSPGCLLPARLYHTRDLAGRGELAQRDPRELELPVIPARTASQHAAVANTRPRAVARQLGELELRRKPLVRRRIPIDRDRLQAHASSGGALGKLLSPRVLLYGTLLRHMAWPYTI